jgi:hypothetical protein
MCPTSIIYTFNVVFNPNPLNGSEFNLGQMKKFDFPIRHPVLYALHIEHPKMLNLATLIGTHQLLVYADDINLLGENINIINENAEVVLDAGKDVDLEVNAEKTKYMVISHHQTTR